jgi:hypothetical protein
MAKPKKAASQPTNGPHSWGNGPKPYGILKRIVKAIQKK